MKRFLPHFELFPWNRFPEVELQDHRIQTLLWFLMHFAKFLLKGLYQFILLPVMCKSASFPTSLAALGILIKKIFFASLIGEELYVVLICFFLKLYLTLLNNCFPCCFNILFFFFLILFIYLFIYGCVGSSFLFEGFL